MSLAENVWEWTREWREVGRNQGRHEGQANILYRLLVRRFGCVPDEVLTRVWKAPPDQLLRWADRLFGAKTLDDVFAER